jgi:hypothetical protein
MPRNTPFRILALIYPIERHVGHWACSSPSIQLVRIIMEGDGLGARVLEAAREFQPDALAIIGKRTGEYLDLLDELSGILPHLGRIPRIYRCQNTVLAHRVSATGGAGFPDRQVLAGLDAWFARACDPRFSLILVQTLADVELIRKALAPARVVACPYGYDTAIFDPDLPELERTTDVGCYFNLRGDPRRARLVAAAQEICSRRGWSFRFVEGVYGHEYARQIRATRVCLHQSDKGEVPYRMYETTALGAVFLSDPLRYGVEKFYEQGVEYLTFREDLSDLEDALACTLDHPARWQAVASACKARARNYTWSRISEEYVVPALRELLQEERTS